MNYLKEIFTKHGSPRLTERIWLIAIIVYLIFAILRPDRVFRPGTTAMFITIILLTTLIPKYPRATTFLFIIALFLTSQIPEFRNEPAALWPIAFIGILAGLGYQKLAWICAVAAAFLSTVSFTEGEFLPNDPIPIALTFALFATAVAIGSFFEREQRKQAALKAELKERREAMTRALHDSVAAKLSSIILRAEALSLSSSLDKPSQLSLITIAEEARLAVGDVRHLLEAIKADENFVLPSTTESLEQQITATVQLLESHELRVNWENQLPDALLKSDAPDNFQNVLSELATNVLKYSPAASIVHISTHTKNRQLILCVTNVVADQQAPNYLTTGLGLEGIKQWAKTQGGHLSYDQMDEIWSIELWVPLTG